MRRQRNYKPDPGSVVLVVDFGGGTLDLSLVRTVNVTSEQQAVRAEVLAKSDAFVGGVDIDTWIVEHYLKQIGSSRTEVGEIGWQNLLEVAEKLKIRLSTADEAKDLLTKNVLVERGAGGRGQGAGRKRISDFCTDCLFYN